MSKNSRKFLYFEHIVKIGQDFLYILFCSVCRYLLLDTPWTPTLDHPISAPALLYVPEVMPIFHNTKSQTSLFHFFYSELLLYAQEILSIYV